MFIMAEGSSPPVACIALAAACCIPFDVIISMTPRIACAGMLTIGNFVSTSLTIGAAPIPTIGAATPPPAITTCLAHSGASGHAASRPSRLFTIPKPAIAPAVVSKRADFTGARACNSPIACATLCVVGLPGILASCLAIFIMACPSPGAAVIT